MKALIFNSGLGSRLGSLTVDKPKSMGRLSNGETILARQLRILDSLGIKEYVITTGPFSDQIEAACAPYISKGCSFIFVNNPMYAQTNYIYSMWLAREHLVDDTCLMLHGDLVFDKAYAYKVICSSAQSLGSVNPSVPNPEKDFKARVHHGRIEQVSVSIFDDDCVAFQPLYKLSANAVEKWLEAVNECISRGDDSIYAEDAANSVFSDMDVEAFSYAGHFVEEVDTAEDLERVSKAIRFFDYREQPVYRHLARSLELMEGFSKKPRCSIDELCLFDKPLVVCGKRYSDAWINTYFEGAFSSFVRFSGFSSNPTYEEACVGYETLRNHSCDAVISIGGGSAIDVAKAIKALDAVPRHRLFDDGVLVDIPDYDSLIHIAIPTTAGTGSESTHFAVVYKNGIKFSVSYDWLMPDAAVLDSALLVSLPDYQKKCTLLDALCQAIESLWSVRSCEESREYSRKAIRIIMDNYQKYLQGDSRAAGSMLRAANYAGKAINITTTTAPHALSYKLSSLKSLPHGHAVALCMVPCWDTLVCSVREGLFSKARVCLAGTEQRLLEISRLMCVSPDVGLAAGLEQFLVLMDELGIERSIDLDSREVDVLVDSVNVQRLSNFPIELDRSVIEDIYKRI